MVEHFGKQLRLVRDELMRDEGDVTKSQLPTQPPGLNGGQSLGRDLDLVINELRHHHVQMVSCQDQFERFHVDLSQSHQICPKMAPVVEWRPGGCVASTACHGRVVQGKWRNSAQFEKSRVSVRESMGVSSDPSKCRLDQYTPSCVGRSELNQTNHQTPTRQKPI